MNRFPSPMVKVAFEGTFVNEELLYQIFRVSVLPFPATLMHIFPQPYGRIQDISPPTPVPASNFRSSVVTFQRIRSATIARNVIHGIDLVAGDKSVTCLRTIYQQPIEVHAIRDWISGHPRIVLPVIVFLLGTLTYTVTTLSPRHL